MTMLSYEPGCSKEHGCRKPLGLECACGLQRLDPAFDGARVAKALEAIFASLPKRLGINLVLADAAVLLTCAVSPANPNATQYVNEKVVEVLREIAAYTVEQFERRTGQRFLWTEPEEPEEPTDILMSFKLDEKGNMVIDE